MGARAPARERGQCGDERRGGDPDNEAVQDRALCLDAKRSELKRAFCSSFSEL
jgi:hypothetical protein